MCRRESSIRLTFFRQASWNFNPLKNFEEFHFENWKISKPLHFVWHSKVVCTEFSVIHFANVSLKGKSHSASLPLAKKFRAGKCQRGFTWIHHIHRDSFPVLWFTFAPLSQFPLNRNYFEWLHTRCDISGECFTSLFEVSRRGVECNQVTGIEMIEYLWREIT